MSLNNRAFTLVELLGVIIVLSVIAVIIYPIYNESITNSKNNLYNQQIKSLENNARRWGVDNTSDLPSDDTFAGYYACSIEFDTLISGGYIAKTAVINPKNNTNLTGCIVIYWDTSSNQYVYDYSEDCTKSSVSIDACPGETLYYSNPT